MGGGTYVTSITQIHLIVVAIFSRLDHRLGVKQNFEFEIEEDVFVEVIVVETQCKGDVANEARNENMQNVVEKKLKSKETRDENEATQGQCFFCYFYSFVCFS